MELTTDQKSRIKHLDFIVNDLKSSYYPPEYEESRYTMIEALEQRKRAIAEGQV